MNKLLTNNKGTSIINAIIVLTISILVIAFFMFAMGTVLSEVMHEFQTLSLSPMSAEFSDSMNSILNLAEMFYIVLIFGLLLFTTWFFKVIIKSHRYSRQYEEEEDEW